MSTSPVHAMAFTVRCLKASSSLSSSLSSLSSSSSLVRAFGSSSSSGRLVSSCVSRVPLGVSALDHTFILHQRSSRSHFARQQVRRFFGASSSGAKQETDDDQASENEKHTEEEPTEQPQQEGEAAAAENGEEQEEMSETEVQIAALEAEKQALKDQVMRAYADAENLRTRMAQQVDNAKSFAIQGFAKDLLDVSDNLERALAAVPEEELGADGHLKSLHEGVAMTNNIMLKTFRNNGLERFDPTGEPFDPNTMMALFEIPAGTPGVGEPGTVAQTQKVGYLLNGRAIRAAEVGVVKSE